jgi:hypothetical protein
LKHKSSVGLVACLYNPSTGKAEAGGLQIPSQPGVPSEFEAILGNSKHKTKKKTPFTLNK